MTYLLDVNVVIALIDPLHIFHSLAHDWFDREGRASWASCPLTENGAVRILGHPRYPGGPGRPAEAASLVRGLIAQDRHNFWADDLSLLSAEHVEMASVATAAQVTDTYLVALAVAKGGRLATLDRHLSPAAVNGGAEALTLIE